MPQVDAVSAGDMGEWRMSDRVSSSSSSWMSSTSESSEQTDAVLQRERERGRPTGERDG